jgi:hypothetical protein
MDNWADRPDGGFVMNSSAKITALSFLAAAALGAAAIQGCTVTSDTNPDTDGGTHNNNNNNPDNTDNGDSGDNTDTTPPDSGDTGPIASQTSLFKPEACQSCLLNNCHTDMATLFGITAESTQLDGNGFKDCVDGCASEADVEACTSTGENSCTKLAAPGVEDAYRSVMACAEEKCPTDCAGDVPDGG